MSDFPQPPDPPDPPPLSPLERLRHYIANEPPGGYLPPAPTVEPSDLLEPLAPGGRGRGRPPGAKTVATPPDVWAGHATGVWSRPVRQANGSFLCWRYGADGRPERRYVHHIVMAAHLDRELHWHETVRHRDADKGNNDLANLELLSSLKPAGRTPEALLTFAREIITVYGDEVTL